MYKNLVDFSFNGFTQIALGDIINISSGKRPNVSVNIKNIDNPIPLIGASGITGYTKNFNYNEKIIIIGRVGTLGVVQSINFPCWASDNTLVIKTKYHEFTNQILKNIDYRALNRGSTQPLITQKDLKKIKIILPSQNYLETFEKETSRIRNLYNNNILKNQILKKIKNNLLPKLLSGEIDISNIELEELL